MAEASAYRGPDGINNWVENNVGFAHLALFTTPESTRETQPLANHRRGLILVADARVDNRTELISTLTIEGYIEVEDPTDADLILAAYERWGEACPEHIIGEFAFMIWDARKRQLVCVRDPMGIRPLFFCRQGQTFYCASTMNSILAALRQRAALNEPFLIEYLCWQFDRWIYETPYQNIFQVPMSHCLIVGEAKEVLDRYWTFGARKCPDTPVTRNTSSTSMKCFRNLSVLECAAISQSA